MKLKQEILQYLKRYAISYAIINLIFLIVSFVLQRRLNIDILHYRASFGAAIIALFIALSITIFRIKKGNEIIKIALGFIALAPIVFITRRVFGQAVFRYGFVIYAFAALCALIYSVAIVVVASRAKQEERDLNFLLKNKTTEDDNLID